MRFDWEWGKLPDLVEILPEARKFGGCYVFGIQSYAQLEDIYGDKGAATLFDVMNTRVFFRSPTRKIAEFAAGEIGEKEILKASEQYSYGVDPVRDGTSVGKDMERVTLVSYSDIQTLPDLSCYITLPGPYPAVKMALKYQPRPKVAPEFIPRTLDEQADARLSLALAAREDESRSLAGLFTPDIPVAAAEKVETTVVASGPLVPVDVPVAPAPPVARPETSGAPPLKSGSSAAAVGVGGTEQELVSKAEEAEELPPGINVSGEVVDRDAFEAWQAEQEGLSGKDRQRREEVNINVHRSPEKGLEPGGYI